MLNNLQLVATDSILKIGREYLQCKHPDKVDLAIGLYQDANGNVPILPSVKQAEQQLWQKQTSKRYTPSFADARYAQLLPKVLFGVDNAMQDFAIAATPGGCGALSLIGKILETANPNAHIWMSNPTWANHKALFSFKNWQQHQYSYLVNNSLDFAAMLSSLDATKAGDIILLQGFCHNPTGLDLSEQQVDTLVNFVRKRNLFAIVDCAYTGMAKSLAEDSYMARKFLAEVPECAVTISCSKIFSLYNDRTGMLLIKSGNKDVVQSQLNAIMRCNYSISPYHGAGVVAELLTTASLYEQWQAELEQMRTNIESSRDLLITTLAKHKIVIPHLKNCNGMFALLGLTIEQCRQLRAEKHIYLLDDSRINVIGVKVHNVEYIVEAIARVR